ncbi:MAG TPA: DedA family protein [Thermoanaerobaculia bacterium]|nr:DedA family protein [Thermoanaerobaculia bacterium]
MEDATRILTEHPYATLFLAVFAEQIGVPFPAVLFLAAAGTIAAMGNASLGLLFVTAVAATLLADLIWFAIGRHRGRFVVKFVSWLSPRPDGVARRAWNAFREHGSRVLVWAKFVPSLSTFTTPLAGAARMSLSRFLVFDGLGTLLWNGAFLAAGFALGPEIGRLARRIPEVGGAPLLIILGGVLAVVLSRWLRANEPVASPVMVRAASGERCGGR